MPRTNQTAYFFVYHGSRDARSGVSARRLSAQVMRAMERAIAPGDTIAPHPSDSAHAIASGRYEVGALELAETPLHEQLTRFSRQVHRQGIAQVEVVPLFLLPGAHVREDIPEEVSLAQRTLGHDVHLTLAPHVGSHRGMVDYLEARCRRYSRYTGQYAGRYAERHSEPSAPSQAKTARIFVNHGSKRPGANEPVAAIAHQLNAAIAYWSMPPSVEMRLDELIAADFSDIIVIPYFLFAGKITDTIIETVQHYNHRVSHRVPERRIHVEPPLGEDGAIAPLLAAWMQSRGQERDGDRPDARLPASTRDGSGAW